VCSASASLLSSAPAVSPAASGWRFPESAPPVHEHASEALPTPAGAPVWLNQPERESTGRDPQI